MASRGTGPRAGATPLIPSLLGRGGSLGVFAAGTGAATPAFTGLTTPLARGTTTLGTLASGHFRPSGTGLLNFSDPATVIDRFIRVIPTPVWIALAALFGIAAFATGAALLSGRRARRHRGEAQAVATAAMTDPLTGLLNRRAFADAVERELERARRYQHPVALAFIDVRGLKAVNDSHGHLAGDRLLQEVGQLMRASARTYDVVARIGGDELAVLLPEQSADGAAALADRIRDQIPARRQKLGFEASWDLTVGTSAFPQDGEDFDQLLSTADRRLYEQRGIYIR